MVESVVETAALENENINKESDSGNAKASNVGNPAAQAGRSSALGGHFSRFFGGGPSFASPAATPPPTVFWQSLPACLMPEPFNESGDFEYYLGQFIAAACLTGWYRPCSRDYRPQFFALRLKTMHCNSFQYFPKITILTLTF